MSRVVTFGEIMLRLSPPGFERFLQSPVLGATFGGGEANVAVCLAQFGLESEYITRLPAHAIGEAAIRALRTEGVSTGRILRGGSRIGVYFAEAGASQRALDGDLRPRALGDQRDGAGRRRLERRDGRRGLVPHHRDHAGARREGGRGDLARARGGEGRTACRVSVDLNYRKKLWTEAQAQAVMGPLMRHVDVVIANEEDLQSVLGVHGARHRRHERPAEHRRVPRGRAAGRRATSARRPSP